MTLPNVDECFLLRSRQMKLEKEVAFLDARAPKSSMVGMKTVDWGRRKFLCWAKARINERIAVLTKCCALDRFSFGDEGLLFKHLKAMHG